MVGGAYGSLPHLPEWMLGNFRPGGKWRVCGCGTVGRLSRKKLLHTEPRGAGPVGEEGHIFAASRDVMGVYGVERRLRDVEPRMTSGFYMVFIVPD